MTSRPRVSVVLPIYNGERYLAHAIDSVLAQSYRSYEIVAVNDGSRDWSAEIVKRYLASHAIKYVEQENRGVAGARNTGIAHSAGELIALLDQDDVWLPSKLEKQVAFIDAHPEVAMLHARVSCIDGAGRPISCKGWIYVDDACGHCAEVLLSGNRIAPMTVVIRRSCLDEVGVFDQAFAPADDWHLWLRIASRFPLGFLDSIVALYRVHDSNESKNQLKMKRAEIAVMESFRSKHATQFRQMDRRAIEAKLGTFYHQTAELLLGAGQGAEAATLEKRSTKLMDGARLYYARKVTAILPRRQRRMIRGYWYRVRSIFGLDRS